MNSHTVQEIEEQIRQIRGIGDWRNELHEQVKALDVELQSRVRAVLRAVKHDLGKEIWAFVKQELAK